MYKIFIFFIKFKIKRGKQTMKRTIESNKMNFESQDYVYLTKKPSLIQKRKTIRIYNMIASNQDLKLIVKIRGNNPDKIRKELSGIYGNKNWILYHCG